VAPPPMTPILSRSPAAALRPAVITPSSVAASQAGAGKVGRQDLRVPLPRPSSADRAPLTESHTVSRPLAIYRDMRHPSPTPTHGQGKRVASEQLAVRRPKDLSNGETIDSDLGTAQRDGEPVHPPRWCTPLYPNVAHLSDQLFPDAGDRRKIPLQGGLKRLGAPLLVPAVPRRDAAVRYPMLVFVGDGTQIGLSCAVKDFRPFGGSPSAGRIEERLSWRAVVGQRNAAGDRDGSLALWCLEQDSAIYLIGDAGGQIEPLRFPFTHVTQREGPRHHRLSLECRLLV